jgi:hypothetical protein
MNDYIDDDYHPEVVGAFVGVVLLAGALGTAITVVVLCARLLGA